MRDFATNLPKAELHIHIEGSLEPEMAFEQAHRNGVELPFSNVASLKAAYDFTDLQSFLDIYYQTAAVLRTERDFYELMSAYLTRAAADGVRRAEVFFDPQTHTERGVGFEVFMKGFQDAIRDVELSADISADLIMCFILMLVTVGVMGKMKPPRLIFKRLISITVGPMKESISAEPGGVSCAKRSIWLYILISSSESSSDSPKMIPLSH